MISESVCQSIYLPIYSLSINTSLSIFIYTCSQDIEINQCSVPCGLQIDIIFQRHFSNLNSQNVTPIHLACASDQVDILQKLWKSGGRVDRIPVVCNNQSDNSAPVNVNISTTSSSDSIASTPRTSSGSLLPSLGDQLVDSGGRSGSDGQGYTTAVHVAALHGSLKCLCFLIECLANDGVTVEQVVQMPDSTGRVPLHEAALAGSRECVDLLLEKVCC